jgi:hypothetical protein
MKRTLVSKYRSNTYINRFNIRETSSISDSFSRGKDSDNVLDNRNDINSNNSLAKPISFSIPEEKIVTTNIHTLIKNKIKILSSLIPGKIKTYIYNTEEDYYNEYRQSFFATTIKKAGWDCMRHYEIIANGCIPYFPNIEKCPTHTMTIPLKILFVKGNALFKQFIISQRESSGVKSIEHLTADDINQYTILLNDFLDYMRENLTTNKIAKYILESCSRRVNPASHVASFPQDKDGVRDDITGVRDDITGVRDDITGVSRVLYLSGNVSPDYLRCLTLHGFKVNFGENCHDYPKVPHIYKSNSINYKGLYGKGITYTNLLDNSLHNDTLDNRIEDDIKNKYYDIIIYGSYHRGMPYYDLICSVYKANEIVLLCGDDIHNCNYKSWTDKGHHVFVRELVI